MMRVVRRAAAVAKQKAARTARAVPAVRTAVTRRRPVARRPRACVAAIALAGLCGVDNERVIPFAGSRIGVCGGTFGVPPVGRRRVRAHNRAIAVA